MSIKDTKNWGKRITSAILLVIGSFFLQSCDFPDVGYEEAKAFVHQEGYTIEKTIDTKVICRYHRVGNNETGVAFILKKDGKTIHAVVCELEERLYKKHDNDLLNVAPSEWVGTKRHLVLVRIIT